MHLDAQVQGDVRTFSGIITPSSLTCQLITTIFSPLVLFIWLIRDHGYQVGVLDARTRTSREEVRWTGCIKDLAGPKGNTYDTATRP